MTGSNNLIVGILVAVVAAAGFFFFALKPKRAEVTRLKGEIATAQKTLDDARVTLGNYERAKSTYKQAYASVIRLGKAVPADDDVRSLMVQIDSAASRSSIDFRSIQVGNGVGVTPAQPGAKADEAALPPGAAVGPAGFPSLPFSFTFSGKFFKLGDFFSRLERFVTVNNNKVDVTGRLMTVDSITLEPDQNGFPNIKASVNATSFLVSPDQGLTAGATPEGPAAAAPSGGTGSGSSPAASTTATSTGAFR